MDENLKQTLQELTKHIKALEQRIASLEARIGVKKQRVPQQVSGTHEPKESHHFNWKHIELNIGNYILQIMGIVVFLFGMGFFLKYSIEQGWISPIARFIIGLVAATSCIIGAEVLHARLKHWTTPLIAGGIVLYYLSFAAAATLYHLISDTFALIALIATTLGACILALDHNAQLIAIMSLFGSLSTPLMLYGSKVDTIFLLQYLFMVTAAFTVFSCIRRWYALPIINIGMLIIYESVIAFNFQQYIWFILAFFFIYNIIPYAAVLYTRSRSLFEPLLIALTGMYAFERLATAITAEIKLARPLARVVYFLKPMFVKNLPLYIIESLCFVFGLYYIVELLLTIAIDKTLRFLIITFTLLMVTCGAGWLIARWNYPEVLLVLIIYAALLMLLGILTQQSLYRFIGYCMGTLLAFFTAFASTTLFRFTVGSMRYLIQPAFIHYYYLLCISFIAIGLLLWLFFNFMRTRFTELEVRYGNVIIALLITFSCFALGKTALIASYDIPAGKGYERVAQTDIFLAIYYGIFALVLITVGLVKKIAAVRYVGLGFTLLVLLRLWFIIMALPATLYRVLAFILVGICLTLASLVYQRLSKRAF